MVALMLFVIQPWMSFFGCNGQAFFKFFIKFSGSFYLPAHRLHSSHSLLMGREWWPSLA
ncbi:hypothetical protein JCM18909_3997 [Cutibacterium acnes JCM 18909]|nr:hypothetical protein JCM18909_3997 [Cutibacterium acnes JCM 18909]